MEQKLGRPKGSKQKRNEDKYKLPNGVTLKLNQTQDYNKETRLVFIDVSKHFRVLTLAHTLTQFKIEEIVQT
jgi:hypothetical protein